MCLFPFDPSLVGGEGGGSPGEAEGDEGPLAGGRPRGVAEAFAQEATQDTRRGEGPATAATATAAAAAAAAEAAAEAAPPLLPQPVQKDLFRPRRGVEGRRTVL